MKTVAAFLTIAVLLAGRPAGGQSDSVASVKEASVRILIAKGHSYLENTVAALIADSLPDYTVTAIPLEDLDKQNHGDFAVIVIFNAVKRDRINSAVRKYIRTTQEYGTLSNLLICTVYGEIWKGKEIAADAVTTATKTLNPEIVASRVLANIRLAVREKH